MIGTVLMMGSSSSRPRANVQKPADKSKSPIIAIAWENGKLTAFNLSIDGTYQAQVGEADLFNILNVRSAIDHQLYKTKIEELEDLINSTKAKEGDFQKFFESNPNLILDDAYKSIFPHVVLQRSDSGTLIPDFILEPTTGRLCDILDLKLPKEKIFIEKKDRTHFSASVVEAAAQLREYSAYFDEDAQREMVEKKYGLQLYKPKMIVVIGRTSTLDPIKAKRAAADIPGLELRTYDDILSRARHKFGSKP